MREINKDEAKKLGVDLSMVATCHKIRNLAKLKRLKLDESVYCSGINKHLLNYIEYCQTSVLDYVREYLSNLQPYMIERKIEQEKVEGFLCIIDKMCQVSVYIKNDGTQFEVMEISFYEDNIRGIAKRNALLKNLSGDKLVPVLADSCGSINQENGNTSIKVFIQRGMKVLPVSLIGIKCLDTFIVHYADIERQFVEYCNQYIHDLYTSKLDLNYEEVEVFTMLQQISYTAYGNDAFSSVSLLIDSLVKQNDSNSKRAADFALVTYTQSLKLTNEQKTDLLSLLDQKYKGTGIEKIDDVLYRIKLAINASKFG